MLQIRQVRASALLGLLLIGVWLLQLGAFDPSHQCDQTSHCCPACYVAHILATAEIATVAVVPPAEAHWYVPVELAPSAAGQLIPSGCSRAPPA